jgi:hypothetical protein
VSQVINSKTKKVRKKRVCTCQRETERDIYRKNDRDKEGRIQTGFRIEEHTDGIIPVTQKIKQQPEMRR